MALWCWNERVDCLSLWNGDSVGIFGFLDFFDFLELMEEVVVLVWWRWPEVWG